MHDKLKVLFDAHETNQRDRAVIMQDTKTLGQFVSRTQRRVMEYREMLLDAETEPDFPNAVRGKLNHVHSVAAAHERAVQQALFWVRKVQQTEERLSKVLSEAKTDIERHEELRGRS